MEILLVASYHIEIWGLSHKQGIPILSRYVRLRGLSLNMWILIMVPRESDCLAIDYENVPLGPLEMARVSY